MAAVAGLSAVGLRIEELTTLPSSISISAAKMVITPGENGSPRSQYMGGYGCNFDEGIRQATGTYAPLYARCIVFWDDGHPKAIVSADVLAFPRSMHQTIRRRVASLTEWRSADFILTATHAHNGPTLVERLDPYLAYGLSDLTAVSAYSNWLANGIVALVLRALHAPQTACTLDYQVLHQGFAYNREGLSYAESDVPALIARNSEGKPVAVLFSYGCHSVSAGSQTLFDPDYPGSAASCIEAKTLAFALYVQGAAGDQNPAGTRGWTLRNQNGHDLGMAIVKAMNTPGRAITGPISTSYREVQLPLDITNTSMSLQAMREDYQARVAAP
jgi:neutral ceramidase